MFEILSSTSAISKGEPMENRGTFSRLLGRKVLWLTAISRSDSPCGGGATADMQAIENPFLNQH